MKNLLFSTLLILICIACRKEELSSDNAISLYFKTVLTGQLQFQSSSYEGSQYSENAILANKGDTIIYIVSQDPDLSKDYHIQVSEYNISNQELNLLGNIRMFGSYSIGWLPSGEVIIPSISQYIGLFFLSDNTAILKSLNSELRLTSNWRTGEYQFHSVFTSKQGDFFVTAQHYSSKEIDLLSLEGEKLISKFRFNKKYNSYKIFIDDSSTLILCDPMNERLVFIDEKGVEELALKGFKPIAIQQDRLGNYFVLESKQNSFLILNSRKEITQVIDGVSNNDFEWNNPTDFVIAAENLVLLDRATNSVYSLEIKYSN